MATLALFIHSLVALSYAHPHAAHVGLPSSWFQRDTHPVHNLFARASNDGATYPAVGSTDWQNQFPNDLPPKEQLPAAWYNALNSAVSAGKIPNLAPTTQPAGPDTDPVYPTGTDPMSPQVCSAYYKCREPGTIWDAPDGVFASSFDDGPLPFTAQLVDFLSGNKLTTTHFMIGKNIRNNPDMFLKAFNAGHDIAVHTWTHPHMTTLTNEQVVAELGQTLAIIRASSGGRVPKYWRPPYGDSDVRVSAIAREVFGLTTIIWNQDTEDWSIANQQTTIPLIVSNLTSWIKGPKSPGLMALEHELQAETVQAFINAFPLIAQNGWKFAPVTQLYDNKSPYRNADATLTGVVTAADILASNSSTSTGSGTSPAASGSPTTPTTGGASNNSTPVSGGNNTNTTQTQQPGAAIALSFPTASVFAVVLALSSVILI